MPNQHGSIEIIKNKGVNIGSYKTFTNPKDNLSLQNHLSYYLSGSNVRHKIILNLD